MYGMFASKIVLIPSDGPNFTTARYWSLPCVGFSRAVQ